ncbi:MAG TPA: acyl-CoA thioesterase domain-containing protein [Acidimicrobiia bacterium]|nr:acyl-CoA thioesterase domain-containing protein [Acidimicrobiia bacterium]
MEEAALFVRDGDAYVGTICTQGAWDPDAANGAAVLALLGHCLEDVPTLVPMSVSRFTADLVRPVPLGRRLHVVPTVLREGKKIQVVELRLLAGEVEHVRATVLRLREAAVAARDGLPATTTSERPADALVGPEDARSLREHSPTRAGFLRAIDLRLAPSRDGSGSGFWVRLDAPVVAGEPIRATSRLTVGFDFANQVGVDLDATTVSLINPDVNAHVIRQPVGEWVAITGDTRFHYGTARGVSDAVLSDPDGVFAVASVSQLVQPWLR